MKNTPENYVPKSSFGRAAMALDSELVQFETYVQELAGLSLESDKGYERSLHLIQEIANTRGRLETSMRGLSTSLNEVRAQNEEAERVVAERTQLVQARKESVDKMQGRFAILGGVVRELNAAMARLKEQARLELSGEDKADIAIQLPGLEQQLDVLVDETRTLVEDARKTNLKSLEKEADSLWKSLTGARNKLKLIIERKTSLEVN